MRTALVVLVTVILFGCGQNPAPHPLASQAGSPAPMNPGEVGNGGHGIMKGGKMYSADLVEAGIEKHPHFHHAKIEDVDKDFTRFLEGGVHHSFGLQPVPYKEITLKLYDIYSYDPMLGYALAHVMQMYQWKISDTPLKPLELKDSVFHFEEGTVHLVANRRGRTIHIYRPFFAMMDAANQTALIFHELIYALIRPQPLLVAKGESYDQPAARVREILAYLFTHDAFWDKVGQEGLHTMISSDELPILPPKSDLKVADADASPDAHVENGVHLLISGRAFEIYATEAKEEKISYAFSDHISRLGLYNAPKELKDICKVVVGHPLGRAHIRVVQKEAGPNYRLQFANYQTKEEIRSYVRFEDVEKLPAIDVSIYYSMDNVEQCEKDLYAEMVRVVLEYDPLSKLKEEEEKMDVFQQALKFLSMDQLQHSLFKLKYMTEANQRAVKYHQEKFKKAGETPRE